MSHFSSDHKSPKDLQMSSKITRVEFDLTPSDFGAQIRESNQIKLLNPLYNRRLRKVRKLFQYRSVSDDRGYLKLRIETVELESAQDENYFGLFRSQRQASRQMLRLADQYFLCHQMLGLETFDGRPCFRSQLKKCLGCCCGGEPAGTYNERVMAAIKNYERKQWPFSDAVVIEEACLEDSENSLWHVIDHWRYMGQVRSADDIHSLGYRVLREKNSEGRTNLNDNVTATAGAEDYLDGRINFDLDIYYILVRFLLSKEKMALNRLRVWPLESLGSQFDCPDS
jgi:DNA polymerase-3 subunit epsilon